MLKAESHKRRYRGIHQFAGSLTRIQSGEPPSRGSAAPRCTARGVRGRAARAAFGCRAARRCPQISQFVQHQCPLAPFHPPLTRQSESSGHPMLTRPAHDRPKRSRRLRAPTLMVIYLCLWYKCAVTSGREARPYGLAVQPGRQRRRPPERLTLPWNPPPPPPFLEPARRRGSGSIAGGCMPRAPWAPTKLTAQAGAAKKRRHGGGP
jgi:hypothetical protein